jgi:thioredoxin
MGHLTEVTTSTFDREVGSAALPALVDFGAPRCPPCRMIEPEVEKIAASYAGRIRVVTCNVDENPELAERFSVFSIPTLLMMKDGHVVGQLVGAVPKRRIEELVEKAL